MRFWCAKPYCYDMYSLVTFHECCLPTSKTNSRTHQGNLRMHLQCPLSHNESSRSSSGAKSPKNHRCPQISVCLFRRLQSEGFLRRFFLVCLDQADSLLHAISFWQWNESYFYSSWNAGSDPPTWSKLQSLYVFSEASSF